MNVYLPRTCSQEDGDDDFCDANVRLSCVLWLSVAETRPTRLLRDSFGVSGSEMNHLDVGAVDFEFMTVWVNREASINPQESLTSTLF